MLVTALVLAVLFVGLCGVGYFGRATKFERPTRNYNEPRIEPRI